MVQEVIAKLIKTHLKTQSQKPNNLHCLNRILKTNSWDKFDVDQFCIL